MLTLPIVPEKRTFAEDADKEPMFLQTAPDQVLFVVRTSGTTSLPKVVPQLKRAVVSNARLLARSIGLSKVDVAVNAVPLSHVGGIYSNLLGSLCVGTSGICLPAFNGELLLQALQGGSHGSEVMPTWYSAVPTIHSIVLETAGSLFTNNGEEKSKLKHALRIIRSGAAALSDDLAHALQD